MRTRERKSYCYYEIHNWHKSWCPFLLWLALKMYTIVDLNNWGRFNGRRVAETSHKSERKPILVKVNQALTTWVPHLDNWQMKWWPTSIVLIKQCHQSCDKNGNFRNVSKTWFRNGDWTKILLLTSHLPGICHIFSMWLIVFHIACLYSCVFLHCCNKL